MFVVGVYLENREKKIGLNNLPKIRESKYLSINWLWVNIFIIRENENRAHMSERGLWCFNYGFVSFFGLFSFFPSSFSIFSSAKLKLMDDKLKFSFFLSFEWVNNKWVDEEKGNDFFRGN